MQWLWILEMEELLIYVLLSTVYQIDVTTIILGFFFWFQVENGVDKSLQFMDTHKIQLYWPPLQSTIQQY